MIENPNRILILGLGNDIMGDDAVGLIAARELKKEFGADVDIFEVSSAGLSLIDVLEGYKRVLILDSIPCSNKTDCCIRELKKEDLSKQYSYSPHYVGLPEIIELATRLGIRFPYEIKALVIEIREKGVIREGLSEETRMRLPILIIKASKLIKEWLNDEYFFEWQDEIESP
jgi:hydrogenase maturation protease